MSKRRTTRVRDDDSSKRRRKSGGGGGGGGLDAMTLARGMSSRWLGPRSKLTALSTDEIDRDLRHMEAYQNACTAYAQQYFIFSNRNLVQSGHYGRNGGAAAAATTAPSIRPDFLMPVRIDPEEEKRLSLLRKRIATSERQREVLETEYVALTAAYVYESQALDKCRQTVDGQLHFLQELVEKRAQVVALQRTRVAMARDALACLEKRTKMLEEGTRGLPDNGAGDIGQIWNDVEAKLGNAERACRSLKVPKELRDVKKENCMPWDARKLPRTPYGLPIYLSQLSSVPDKGAAFGCGGIFGSKKSSMAWLQSNLPRTLAKMNREQQHVKHLSEDAQKMQEELEHERKLNKELQRDIAQRRKKNDEMCALATILRSETEAVLSRHNILLDTPEARAVAQDLHSKAAAAAKRKREEENTDTSERGDSGEASQHDKVPDSVKVTADMDHDGDDEGDDEEDQGDEMFD